MQHTTGTQSKHEEELQAEREWKAWKAEHHARREAKGYNRPVSDEEALKVLGVL